MPTATLAALVLAATAALAASGPYAKIPAKGDAVRFDASAGGQKIAWAYHDEQWLMSYLQVAFEAADSATGYSDAQSKLDRVADHVVSVDNGTRGTVEDVKPVRVRNHEDVEVRVMVEDGKLQGQELWTTCAELVDKDGHAFLKP